MEIVSKKQRIEEYFEYLLLMELGFSYSHPFKESISRLDEVVDKKVQVAIQLDAVGVCPIALEQHLRSRWAPFIKQLQRQHDELRDEWVRANPSSGR